MAMPCATFLLLLQIFFAHDKIGKSQNIHPIALVWPRATNIFSLIQVWVLVYWRNQDTARGMEQIYSEKGRVLWKTEYLNNHNSPIQPCLLEHPLVHLFIGHPSQPVHSV